MKKCKDCQKEKPQSEFYGIQGECKECTRKRVSKNYHRNRPYYRQYDFIRNKTQARKLKRKEYQDKRRKVHTDRYKANQMVGNAIRDGRLIPKPCEVCGAKAEAHHPDYNKPLEVMWLCLKHHREEHRKMR